MKVAIVIPCLNEELTIRKVIADSQKYLPHAEIYVVDNGSTDATAVQAEAAGAHVVYSPLRGKANAIRHAFRVIDADFLIMTDGDGTYPLAEAPKLLQLAQDFNYDMVSGSRLELGKPQAFPPLHHIGNHFLTRTVRWLFGFPLRDLMTGFRVFSRRFTQEVNLISGGFDLEPELTIRAAVQNFAFCEVDIPYRERPLGSQSKLRTFRDGWKVLFFSLRLFRHFRPLAFYNFCAGLSLVALALVPSVLQNFFSVLAALFMTLGFCLDAKLTHQCLQRSYSSFVNSAKHHEPTNSRSRNAA